MKAGDVVFQKLLDGKIQYVVPLWQRTYSWDEKQWEQLWHDLLDVYDMPHPRNHFIGSVVTQQITSAPEDTTRYTLIDGQQRMTTLFLILSIIRSRALRQGNSYGELANEILETCLINKYTEGDERNKLLPTQRDRVAFAEAIEGSIPTSGSQISAAYEYFDNVLTNGDNQGDEIDLRRLHGRIVNYLDMVSIHLEDNDSPNRIFESLNNTGLPLTVADSIRNFVLMHISDVTIQESAYDDHWYPMEQVLSHGAADVFADFFWHYLMMDGSLPRKDETYEEIKSSICVSSLESCQATLQRFSKFSKFYAQIAGLDTSELDHEVHNQLNRLNRWEVAVSYPFLMRAFDAMSLGTVTRDALLDVMIMLESFVIRRAVCGVPTNQLRRIFAQLANQVEFGDLANSTKTHLLRNNWPSDDDFRTRFLEFNLYLRGRIERCNLILWTLEHSFGHKETPQQTDQITIEHIMPQTLNRDWIDAIGAQYTEVHSKWLNTIGNLTLSAYNPELSNKPFREKKAMLSSSNLALNESLQNFEAWNATSIQDRGADLAERALKIWQR